MNPKTIGLVIISAILCSSPVHAQFADVLPNWFDLTREDMEAIGEAEERILEVEPLEPGTAAYWQGLETGNRGRITVEQQFEKRGYSCIQATYFFKFARTGRSIRYVVDWCELPDGIWKMVD